MIKYLNYMLILFLASCASGTATEPTKTALTFINSYTDNCNKMNKAVEVSQWVNASNLVTAGFRKELKRMIDEAYKKEPIVGLDADPIFDAQNFPEKGFELVSYDEGTGYMIVKGIDMPDLKVAIKVIQQNSKWLIDGCGMVNIPDSKKPKR